MGANNRFLLRKSSGDLPLAAEADVRDCLQMGQCRPSDFLFDFEKGAWFRVGDHPALAAVFGAKPAVPVDRKVIYFLLPGVSAPQGPFSTKEIQQKAQAHELCDSTWVFVDGDKEWRQVRGVKVLHEMLPPLPEDVPGAQEAGAAPAGLGEISLEGLSDLAPAAEANRAAPLELSLGSGLDQPEAPPAPPPAFHPKLEAAAPAEPAPGAAPANAGIPSAFIDMPDPGGLSNPSIPSLILDVTAVEEPTPIATAKPKAPEAGAGEPFAQALLASNGFERTREVTLEEEHDSPPAAPPAAAPKAPPGQPIPHAKGGEATREVVIQDESDREEATMALDTLGLSLSSFAPGAAAPASAPPGPPPVAKAAPKPAAPPPMPAAAAPPARPAAPVPPAALPTGAPPAAPSSGFRDGESFDGIVAEIPSDPIWLVKPAGTESVSGPFRFLDVVKFLSEGKLTKYDKISRVGTKSFVKILQQYEFNVKYSIETVVERGVERQKILIKRRHPRVPYITGVQVLSKQGMLAGNCVNISAGGVLMEVPKAEFNLGEVIELKILPGLIPKSISCKALVIGKIPKIPPGYALKFEDLKNEDKEAIEFYVQETLKRELPKKN